MTPNIQPVVLGRVVGKKVGRAKPGEGDRVAGLQFAEQNLNRGQANDGDGKQNPETDGGVFHWTDRDEKWSEGLKGVNWNLTPNIRDYFALNMVP